MATEGLDDLITEGRRPSKPNYDSASTLELVQAMNAEDATVAGVVESAGPELAALIESIVERLARGGRLVYVGAGTSGRLAALDAAECEPTFSTEPGQVVALVAGADREAPADQDAAEDDAEAGARAVRNLDLTAADTAVALSASGRTPYVLGAIRAAREAGALTAAVVSTPDSELARLADHEIAVVVGPEFIAGSTRLKAGTAQKLVLNTISTVAMVRLGKTFGDLMVDVSGTNEKLRARARRTVVQATGASADEVDAALETAGGNAKVAIVSLLAGVDAESARARLDEAGGKIADAIGVRA